MAFSIKYGALAHEQIRNLRAFERAAILKQIDKLLTIAPNQESKTTIKLLRQPALSQYRLRVGNYRVFYRVENEEVLIVQVLHKQDIQANTEEGV